MSLSYFCYSYVFSILYKYNIYLLLSVIVGVLVHCALNVN